MDRFADATVLKMEETAPDKNGRYERKRLVRTDFKYPLILLKESVQIDSLNGTSRLLKQSAMVADHVMIKVKPGASENEVNQAVLAYGGRVRKKMHAPDLYLVEFQNVDLNSVSQAIQQFGSKDSGLIVYAEPDYIEYALSTTPSDPRFGELWGMHNIGQISGTPDADIDAPEAWDITTGSRNILVAVIDTGIDYNHADLAANTWVNPGEAGSLSTNGIDDDGNGFIDDCRGWDFYNDDNDSMDDNSHGTHCAGTIGAVGNNSTGVAGVCWNVSLVGIKFLNASGSGFTSDGIDATVYAARLGARLISASYGGGSPTAAGYESIETAAASNMLFIAAAGNSAEDNDVDPHYPSSYTNANLIAVANSTRTDTLSPSSCYGAESVDLAAPGSSILSTVPNNGYGTKSGTSMATPHVAGAAALLWSYNPGMTAAEVKAALMANVDTNAAFAGKMMSGGRLNVDRALRSLSGLHFDRADYFPAEWATLTLINSQLSGSATQCVQIATDNGDPEILVLHESLEQNQLFTNRILIV
jgi:subtilisin family serine protease